jgi:HD-GYP domain-containing protein (c-di-GMP phosphodiesterase class II)
MATKIEKLKNVIGVDSILNKIQDLDILLETILSEARNVLNADAGSIYIKEGDELAITYAQNNTKAAELKPGEKLVYSVFRIPIGTSTMSGYAALTGEIINVRNVYNLPEEAPYSYSDHYDKVSGYRTVSTLCIPLKTNMGDILGVLQLINKKDSRGRSIAFSKDDELVAGHFATNATMALQRATMTRAILLRMTKMSELRDPKETGTHVNRVAGYALEIYERWADRNGIPRHEIDRTRDTLRMAAMLHDVGKVAISDTILKKPGRLTPEERVVMESHAWHGARLFTDRQSEFDEIAQQVALNHHEFWDGTGYPGHIDVMTGEPIKKGPDGKARGKKGKEIHVFGRIVAISDVYDALCSNRVYKKAWSKEDAVREIRNSAGTQFDPDLVQDFIGALPSIQIVADKFAEGSSEPELSITGKNDGPVEQPESSSGT